jgi:hypothetical protein
MGHDSVRAAMIYQHAAAEAGRKIANAPDERIGTMQGRASRPVQWRKPTVRRNRYGRFAWWS